MDPYTDDKKKRAAQGIDGAMPPNSVNGVAVNPATMPQVQAIAQQPGAVAPAPRAAAPAIDAGVQPVVNTVNQATANARNNIASGLNPMSVQGELQNRLNIALDPRGGNKGSPMARQLAARAIMGQMDAYQQAGSAGIQPIANAALQGQQGGIQGQLQGQAQGAAADLSAQQAGQQMQLQELAGTQQAGLEGMRQQGQDRRQVVDIAGNIDIAKIGKGAPASYQRGADGTVNLIEGGKATAVKTEGGDPFKAPDDISMSDRYKAYNEQVAAVNGMIGQTPEQRNAALQALKSDPMYAPLFQQQGAAPGAAAGKPPANAQEFIKAVRAQGSKLSDAELTSYYNQKYGQAPAQ